MEWLEIFQQNFELYKAYFYFQLAHPTWDNPFYIIPAICLIAFTIELVFPKKMDYQVIGRKGFFQDLIYVIFYDYLLLLIGLYAFTSTVEYLFKNFLGVFGIENYIIWDIKAYAFWLQFLIVFLIMDFLQWFGHYLLHRVDFLWKFHKIHHAQEQLGFASTRHFHWFEYFVFKPLLFVPFMCINFSVTEFIGVYLWVGYGFTFFSHCNVRMPWKWLNLTFITPRTHFWHHAKNTPKDKPYGVNFASTTTIWDHIFGFYYLPKDEKIKPILGVEDQKRMPKSFIGQMIAPFRDLFNKHNGPTKNMKLSRGRK
jgi:sterol desaturase/sphingolipid hydroxylase (fatty acid hydroxylase superfamily)